MKTVRRVLVLLLVIALGLPAEETVDLSVVHRIKTEAFENTKVMDTMFQLTDVHGPRLTNSPQFREAGQWAVSQLKEFGLSNVKLEKWGPFGPGWSYSNFSASMVEPKLQNLLAFPVAWTHGTEGPLVAEATLAVIRTEADLEKFKGKLRGKIVLRDAPRNLLPPTEAASRRYTEANLADMNNYQIPAPRGAQGGRGPVVNGQPDLTPQQAKRLRMSFNQFLKDEGVPLVVRISAGDGGLVYGGGADRDNNDNVPTVMLAAEHYNQIVRMLEHKIAVKLRFDIKNEFDSNQDSFNIIGEIPGTSKREEIVMIGAHFDSWHYATGATDNAAGSTVAMEALRILKALDLKMDRTVRIALWSGEEQGLLGSKAYVKEHFADPTSMKTTSEHDRFAAYFNLDNGTGRIRGVYSQNNDAMRPIFEKWFEPFKDLGAGAVILRNTGGTDHLSFDAVGLPGFQFIQDPIDYGTRTHHSNMDVYDRIQATDLEQAAAVMASFVYNAATRPEKLPRKPLPKAKPVEPENTGGAASTR